MKTIWIAQYTQSFIIPRKILKINYKQTIQWIIILMPIEPETLQVLLTKKKNSIALLAQFTAMIKINYIVP